MERLSYRPDDGLEQILFQNPADLEGNYDILDLAARFAIGDGTVAQILTAIAEKIAAYEDSGLTPERVAELAQAEREKGCGYCGQVRKSIDNGEDGNSRAILYLSANNKHIHYMDAKGKLTIFNINYCPMCGRELEVNNE
jgi:hypothetical protein